MRFSKLETSSRTLFQRRIVPYNSYHYDEGKRTVCRVIYLTMLSTKSWVAHRLRWVLLSYQLHFIHLQRHILYTAIPSCRSEALCFGALLFSRESPNHGGSDLRTIDRTNPEMRLLCRDKRLLLPCCPRLYQLLQCFPRHASLLMCPYNWLSSDIPLPERYQEGPKEQSPPSIWSLLRFFLEFHRQL